MLKRAYRGAAARPAICGLLLLASMLAASPLAAAPFDPRELPRELQDWAPWVLDELGDEACTATGQDSRRCVWPGELSLDVSGAGAGFRLTVTVEQTRWVSLPGGIEHWPENVQSGPRALVVRDIGSAPFVELGAGKHTVTGRFEWTTTPAQLSVPEDVGQVRVRIGGRPVGGLRQSADMLNLAAFAQAEEPEQAAADVEPPPAGEAALLAEAPESVELKVFRRLTDGMPPTLTTRLEVTVAGKPRELSLGRPGVEGTEIHHIESDLATRFDDDGVLFMQARPGRYSIETFARVRGRVDAFQAPTGGDGWPQREIWVWEPAQSLRDVTLAGPSGIDSARTELPGEWRHLSAYVMPPGEVLSLQTTRRGAPDPSPNELSLDRTLWLVEDGSRWVVRDMFSGMLGHDGRLELSAGELGRFTLGHGAGSDQVLTAARGDERPGIELRAGDGGYLTATAEWRMPASTELPVSGWNQTVRAVRTELQLPPDVMLLHLDGVDSPPRLWHDSIPLEHVIVAILLALVVWRLTTLRVGAACLLALLLGLCLEVRHREELSFIFGALLAVAATLKWASPRGIRVLASFAYIPIALLAGVAGLEFFDATVSSPELTGGHSSSAYETVEEETPEWLTDVEEDEGGKGKRHKDEEGAMGRRARRASKNKFGIEGPDDNEDPHMAREEAKEMAMNAGILGILSGKQGFGGGGGGGMGAPGSPGLGSPPPPAGPAVKSRHGDTQVRGALSKTVIRRVVRGNAAQVERCVRRASGGGKQAGRVTVKFVVGADGGVKTAAVPKSTLGNADAEKCIGEAVRGWSFPKPQGGGIAVVTHGIVLSRVGADGAAIASDEPPPPDEPDEAPAIAPTGFGTPSGYYISVAGLEWQGETGDQERFRVWLVGTGVLRAFGLLAGGLMLWVIFMLLAGAGRIALSVLAEYGKRPDGGGRGGGGRGGATAALVLGLLAAHAPARAEPSSEVLDDMRQRLTRGADCQPGCTSVTSASGRVTGGVLELALEVHVTDGDGYPLPGPVDTWRPEAIRVDGRPATAIALDGSLMLLRLPAGRHRVQLRGPLRTDDVSIQFKVAPKRITMHAPGWRVDGTDAEPPIEVVRLWRSGDDMAAGAGATDGVEVRGDEGAEPEDAQAVMADTGPTLPSWIRVARDLDVDLSWKMKTTVSRSEKIEQPFAVRYPLLKAERVTSANVEVKAGEALLSFAPGEERVVFWSRLDATDKLELEAADGRPWNETWSLHCSALWQCASDGLPPVARGDRMRFEPWPGEKLLLTFAQPKALGGIEQTVDSAELDVTQRERSQGVRLTVELRQALAGSRTFTLPTADTTIRKVTVDGSERPPTAADGKLTLALEPGAHKVVVEMERAKPMGAIVQTPKVEIDGIIVNASTELDVELRGGATRMWLWGWGEDRLPLSALMRLAAWLGLAWLLGSLGLLPLDARALMLIVSAPAIAGSSQIAPGLLLSPLLLLGLLTARRSWVPPGRWARVLFQILIVGVAALACAALLEGLPELLRAAPNVGRAHRAHAEYGELPALGMFSLPGWTWKVVVTAWAAWLGWTLFQLRGWAIDAFTVGGIWRSADETAVVTAGTSEGAQSTTPDAESAPDSDPDSDPPSPTG